MICSSNGVRLLSSHLVRDTCISIYEGVFQRTMNSGIWTLSRVIRVGGYRDGTVNLNNSSVLPNTSIRGSDFQKGFEDWCNCYDKFKFFSSEGEKDYMFKWFCHNYPYGCHFRFGCRPYISPDVHLDHIRKYENEDPNIASKVLMEKLRQAPAFPRDDEEDHDEVYYSTDPSWDELHEYHMKRSQGDRLADIEPGI